MTTDNENHRGTDPDATLEERADDPRPDIEQAVESRADAVQRGEGGDEPATMTNSGEFSGVAGTGGVVTNQDDSLDAQ